MRLSAKRFSGTDVLMFVAVDRVNIESWKRRVEPIESPPFTSVQNVSSSKPVIPPCYRDAVCRNPM